MLGSDPRSEFDTRIYRSHGKKQTASAETTAEISAFIDHSGTLSGLGLARCWKQAPLACKIRGVTSTAVSPDNTIGMILNPFAPGSHASKKQYKQPETKHNIVKPKVGIVINRTFFVKLACVAIAASASASGLESFGVGELLGEAEELVGGESLEESVGVAESIGGGLFLGGGRSLEDARSLEGGVSLLPVLPFSMSPDSESFSKLSLLSMSSSPSIFAK